MKKVFTVILSVAAAFVAMYAAEERFKYVMFRDGAHLNELNVTDIDSVNFSTEKIETTESELMNLYLKETPGATMRFDLASIDSVGFVKPEVCDSALTYASYKISDTKRVFFSKGNLQYDPIGTHETSDSTAKGVFRFAENQYDLISTKYVSKPDWNTTVTDLFPWGTSGWSGGVKSCEPNSTSATETDYYPGGDYSNNLTGSCIKADWGVYNAIANGGGESNLWRTLTSAEWQYLLKNNDWTMGYVKKSETDTVLCLMLIPEGFTAPAGIKVKVLSPDLDLTTEEVEIANSAYSGNVYTAAEFKVLEKTGVVALPIGGGTRRGFEMADWGSNGYYWSSTSLGKGYASTLTLQPEKMILNDNGSRGNARSVRLVQCRTCNVKFVNADGTILFDTTVAKGATPAYTRATPAMTSTENYAYRYKGWDKQIAAAESNTVYTAVYDCICNVKFVNADGTTLLDTTVAKGATPAYTRATPAMTSTENYAYRYKGWDKQIAAAECNTVYTAVYDSSFIMKKNGAIRYAYKVSASDSVYFSQGNLQFNAAQGTHKTVYGTEKGTWRFAENQYDYIGSSNYNISETYDGWIDLFGWGTSGWNSGATAYQPWSTSEEYSDYYPGGSDSNNLTGDYANADWGVYNAISNGGNEPNQWRTLTIEEWVYLFVYNKWTLGYIKDGSISYLCYMLIPATFTAPEGTTVQVIGTADLTEASKKGLTVPSTNTYTTEQFASLENLGVVALPCAGRRYGTSVYNVGSSGYYWSSSANSSSYAFSFYFHSTGVESSRNGFRYGGFSVRIVQDVSK